MIKFAWGNIQIKLKIDILNKSLIIILRYDIYEMECIIYSNKANLKKYLIFALELRVFQK